MPDGDGSARNTWNAKPITITPTRPAMTASSGRKPRACRPRIAKAMTPVTRPARNSGVPNSRWKPSAAPMNSARSVAIAIASAWIQSANDVRREKRSRHTSGRLRPVAIPSLALIDWMIIAMMFAARITHSSM